MQTYTSREATPLIYPPTPFVLGNCVPWLFVRKSFSDKLFVCKEPLFHPPHQKENRLKQHFKVLKRFLGLGLGSSSKVVDGAASGDGAVKRRLQQPAEVEDNGQWRCLNVEMQLNCDNVYWAAKASGKEEPTHGTYATGELMSEMVDAPLGNPNKGSRED